MIKVTSNHRLIYNIMHQMRGSYDVKPNIVTKNDGGETEFIFKKQGKVKGKM